MNVALCTKGLDTQKDVHVATFIHFWFGAQGTECRDNAGGADDATPPLYGQSSRHPADVRNHDSVTSSWSGPLQSHIVVVVLGVRSGVSVANGVSGAEVR
jgi:hypothetical protein